MRYVIDFFMALSIFFAFAGVIGMLRMPDAYCRMQSSTNISTLGVLGVIIGGACYSIAYLNNYEMFIKLLVLGLFYILTSPIAGHAIAKGAYHHGVKMDKKTACDKYGEDMEEC